MRRTLHLLHNRGRPRPFDGCRGTQLPYVAHSRCAFVHMSYDQGMPRDPHIPDAFDVYTVVILRRPDDAPEFSEEELESLQARHLAYRAGLVRQGVLVANGPFDQQSDPSYRGMSIYACDAAEAARLSDADPSVIAGRLAYDVMEWWIRAGSLAFPLADRRVGERRSMPDD